MDLIKTHLNFIKIIFLFMLFYFSGCNSDNPTKYEPPTLEVNFPPIDEYPSFSPDGNKIMYYHLGISKINSDGSYTINSDSAGLWLINIDGTSPRIIMKGINIYADWSPNGDWLVINQGGQIFKAPFIADSINISEIVQLTFEGRNFFPNWSPDGQWIAYDNTNCGSMIEPPPPNSCGIFKIKDDGTNKQFLVRGRMPNWSSTEDNLIYIGLRNEIFKVNLNDTSNQTQLTRFNDLNPYSNDNRYPKYSPDGNKIVFESQAESDVPKVWTMNSKGDNLFCLTSYGGINSDYSITGKIAYIHYNYRIWQNNEKTNGTLWIMDSDGNNKQQLTFGPYR
ncbi:MAG: PD40 domain-containing protein [Ignavibacterium sp.]|jgi:Tol biopolymer transport system component|nr:PD40 domain-containing protein [Ignavibacterium sp.]